MGITVCAPHDAVWAARIDYEVDTTYHECTRCGHPHYVDDAPTQCEDCGLTSTDACTPFLPAQYDADLSAHYWEAFVGNITETLMDAFPSLYPCDKWLRREDRVILENSHAYIGISEYDDTVFVWCIAKDCDENGFGWETHGLAERWARSIEKRAQRLLKPASVPEPLRMAA